jgi:CRP-like cAMP-binding protein
MTNTSLLKPFVNNLESHALLTDDDIKAIYDLPFKSYRYRANSVILREDHSSNDCLILSSGYACALKMTSNGSRQIVSLYLPGDGLNFQNIALQQLDYSVVALSDVEILSISCDELSKLKENHQFVERALDIQLVIEASTLREWMLSISRREAFVRLATCFVSCAFGSRSPGSLRNMAMAFHSPSRCWPTALALPRFI